MFCLTASYFLIRFFRASVLCVQLLLFFGKSGIGKGFQLFLIFLTETGGLSRVRKCSSKSCLGLSDTFFLRVCKSVVKGEGIATYFGLE